MVRAIIGCMIDVGRKKLDYESTKIKFIKGEKIKTTYLRGNALFLKKIYY
jgi:tRNA U38,U39,U40 pseudouridine synthase TruA